MLAILAVGIAFSGGCATGYVITKRDAIDKAIATARADTETRMEVLRVQEVKALRDTITSHVSREQTASDYLFKGSVTFSTLRPETISRPTLVMGQSIQQTAAQLPPATPAAQAATFKALQIELDETRVSTQVLIAQYEKELGQARAIGEAKTRELAALDTKIQEVEKEREKVLSGALKTERDLQAAKDKVQDKDLAEKTREAEQAKSVQAIKLKLSSIVGVLALLCLAGAIWSPVFKEKFGIGAAVLGLASVAIWFIEGWMVAVAMGVALLVLIAWAARNHYIESKAATSVYRAVQAVKDTAKDDYERVLKPKLEEWMTTYDSKTGTTVPDTAAIKHVDEVLMKAGDL